MVKSRKSDRVFVNRGIRAQEVRCIDHNDENIGIVSIFKALELAEKEGLDLVQISYSKKENVPTCKIIDYGKYKYELSKRNRERAKKQRNSTVKIKEVKFRPNTDSHDLQTKASRARKFLEEGHRVKVEIMFRGRETSHKDIAFDKLDTFIGLIGDEVNILDSPRMNERSISAILDFNKKNVERAS